MRPTRATDNFEPRQGVAVSTAWPDRGVNHRGYLMSRSLSRRELVGLGAVTGAALVGPFAGATGLASTPSPAFPWEYRTLDV